MKAYRWDSKKNEIFQLQRAISFEQVVIAIEQGKLLDVVVHPNKERYPNQKLLIVEIKNYAFIVPFVESEDELFLKTIIPSRKATRKYLLRKNNGN